MNVLVTGSSGLVGSALVKALESRGDSVTRLVRRPPRTSAERRWDPERGELDSSSVAGFETVVHLSGENLGEGRWTAERKQRLWDSRVESTRLLSESIAALDERPAVLVSASAMGYYGDCGDQLLTEESPQGSGFLARLCGAWEAASTSARNAGVRVVLLRMGLILDRTGGALAKMLLPFRMGLGGVLGSGRQYLSWVVIDDLIAAICHLIERSEVAGPINIASPEPVRNREFTRALNDALRRPGFPGLPKLVLRTVLGEMADQTLLSGQRLVSKRLEASGFDFRFATIDEALSYVLSE